MRRAKGGRYENNIKPKTRSKPKQSNGWRPERSPLRATAKANTTPAGETPFDKLRTSRRYEKTERLAAVEGGVADVAAGDEVDDVFGDVGGVVADAFEIFGDHDEFEGREDDGGIFHHVGEQLAKELIAKAIDLVVTLEDGLREFLVAADKRVEAIADHGFGEFAHARKIDVRLYLRVAHDAHGGMGDVDGLIADAFKVAIDARHGEKKAEVGSHGRLKSQGALNALVDFDLHFVDGVFLGEDGFGEALVAIENGVDGLVDGAFGEAAHPEKALFEFVEI